MNAGKLSKGDKLGPVDHGTVSYLPFRKNFYIEVPELARLSEDDVMSLRKELDGIKVWALSRCCIHVHIFFSDNNGISAMTDYWPFY